MMQDLNVSAVAKTVNIHLRMFALGSLRKSINAFLLALLAGLFSTQVSAQQVEAESQSAVKSINTAFLKQQDDVSAVSQVVLRERQARDRAWWDQMSASYWPDAHIVTSWFEGDAQAFVENSKIQYENGAHPVHSMFSPVVDINGKKAHVEITAMSWNIIMVQGKQARATSVFRMNYKLEKRHGEWRILTFTPIYDYDEISPAVAGETVTIPAHELANYRRSYALLCWIFAQQGLSVPQDLLGDDMPEQRDAFYADIKRWLNR